MRRLPLYQAVVVCYRDLKMSRAAIAVAYRLDIAQVGDVVRRSELAGPSHVRRQRRGRVGAPPT